MAKPHLKCKEMINTKFPVVDSWEAGFRKMIRAGTGGAPEIRVAFYF